MYYCHPQAHLSGDVTLEEGVSLWPMAVVRGDMTTLFIGKNCNIQDGAVLHSTHASPFYPEAPLYLGQGVTVGHQACLHGATIHDYCLIGIGASVLDGAVIESDTMIGAHALVTPGQHLEGGWVYMGSPAKPVRRLKEEERAYLRYSAEHYHRLAKQHLPAFPCISPLKDSEVSR